MLISRLMRGFRVNGQHRRPIAPVTLNHRFQVHRQQPAQHGAPLHSGLSCRAASSAPDDRSWSELASEAARLARGALSKATLELRKGIEAVLPAPSRADTTRRGRHGAGSRGLFKAEGLVGFVLEHLMQQVGSKLREGQQRMDDISLWAAAVVETDPRVRGAMGGGTVRASRSPTSQSSSTMFLNGQRSAEISLLLRVTSSSGSSAVAQVTYQEGQQQRVHITLQTDRGHVVELDADGRRPSEPDVIDVDWREIK